MAGLLCASVRIAEYSSTEMDGETLTASTLFLAAFSLQLLLRRRVRCCFYLCRVFLPDLFDLKIGNLVRSGPPTLPSSLSLILAALP